MLELPNLIDRLNLGYQPILLDLTILLLIEV